ncbi:serine/arginine repetitive matrix protein 4 [Takifugu rubripes]|uniref:Serine/arginine repetitive matrix 4 n=1 Tax=Takifugu rubripes TaxID=31033 RepID=A0A674NYD5_TAKRU|nr:serine/arginine repetitive matrix protein 4 [Takifugu rubripes]
MQPPCPLQLPHCRPSLSLGSQLEEKLLFEKFWKGTFKAVASPRPESVIVASITARKRLSSLETTACQSLKRDETSTDGKVDTKGRNGCIKGKGRKRHRRARSPSLDEEVSPRPKRRKKRKSERKRKRSPSHSLSPPRKKKKKKKKRSKKSKRHRYTSKKSKHSSSSLKRKRKEERKHKKSSRTHSRHKRRYQRSDLDSSPCQSSREDRHHLQKSVVHRPFGDLVAVAEDSSGELDQTDMRWRPAAKSLCKTAPKYRSILSTATILPSHPGNRHSRSKESRQLTGRSEGLHGYDSGNDTFSPPSSKSAISPASATEGKRSRCKHVDSPERLKITDDVSDSGNSVTSYDFLCKSYREDGFPATVFNKREEISVGCRVEVTPQKTSSCSRRMSRSSQSRRSCRRSSGSSKYCGRHSRSRSLSSCSSYSRSPSYSSDFRRRGSVASLSSAGSYCRYSSDRLRARSRSSSSRKTDVKRTRKSRKRRRRRSYSPLKKRRRDSPSHLEARRITSARKRPIPYFRPSPSSISRSTSISSWSSIFTRSRSRSRSLSYSSYGSYSRSSSWNSVFGSCSRSRSRERNRSRH